MTTRAGTSYHMEDLQQVEERRGEEGGGYQAERRVQGSPVGGRDGMEGGRDGLASVERMI